MQIFKDSVTQQFYSFEDDVVPTEVSGVYSFATAAGVALTSLPTTLQPAAAPTPPAPSPAELAAQAYAAFLAGGLTVTFTSIPALSGVYAIDPDSQTDIATEAQFISTFAEFTTGATTNLPWPMPNGSVVIFPTTAAFLSLAKAAGQAVAAAKLALATSGTMPAATATIP